MRLIKPSFEILSNINREDILKAIEIAGRTCYKSEDKIIEDSARNFVRMITDRGHLSVLEHQSMTVRFIVDRGVSHELVRHRIASFSQESTRYCNYANDKFGKELTFILPNWISSSLYGPWDVESISLAEKREFNFEISQKEAVYLRALESVENTYVFLIQNGWTPQQARSILPNSLKTEIVITANMREWKEIFRQRTSPAAHPQMREVMCPLQEKMQDILPEIFGDNPNTKNNG